MTKKQPPRTPQQQAVIDTIPGLQHPVEPWPGYWKEIADARKIECDKLRRRLEELWDDPRALCEKCTIGERTAGIEGECSRLQKRLKEARVAFNELDTILGTVGLKHEDALEAYKYLNAALNGEEE